MARRRFRRKDLKRPDEFVSRGRQVLEWLQANVRLVAQVGGAVAIGVLLIAGVLSVRYGFSPIEGLLAGLVPSLLCALALSWATMRLRGLYLAIATLAFSLLIDLYVLQRVHTSDRRTDRVTPQEWFRMRSEALNH